MDEIKHLEYLSKLEFSGEEREKFKADFNQILAFVDQIKAIETDESADSKRVMPLTSLREDEAKPSLSREIALKNAPIQEDGCFVTPLVVE